MTLKVRILERVVNAGMVFLVFMTVGIYSCFAQPQQASLVNFTVDEPLNLIKNAGKGIRHHANVNFDAQAKAINPAINGPYEELKPVLAPCGKQLYFSRLAHPNNTFGEFDQEDIWYSEYDDQTGMWSDPIRMHGELNNAGPNFINNVSATGDTIILGNQYLKNGKMKAGLSYSVNIRGRWLAPKPIYIHDDYNLSNHANAYVSLNAGIIIQSVQRVDSYGGRDLYVSFWNGKVASQPLNMGRVINTEMEESSPFLAADNRTLYFASKGHNGYGGYDIYVTRRLDDTWLNWSEPENLGPAVNSSRDDEFFSITHCGNYAFFSRQISVHNVDLFRISTDRLFIEPIKQPLNRSGRLGNSAVASL